MKYNTLMKEKKKSSKFINFFDRKSKLSDAPKLGSVESVDSSDGLKGRHPVNTELKEHHPTTVSNNGQGLLLRGSKRHVPGELSSPAKRMKQFTENFEMDNPVGSQRTDGNNEKAAIGKQIIRKVRFVGPGQVRMSSEVELILMLETI